MVSDVDGVVVPIKSSWGFIHEKLGTIEESRRNYELFRKGVIGYWEWMYLDTLAWIEAWPGITRWDLEKLFQEIHVLDEARQAISLLHNHGVDVVLVSGGVDLLVERVARELGIRKWFANRLVFDARGQLVPGGFPVVEGDRKDKLVKRIAKEYGVSLRETAFIGDSVWDLHGMRETCLAIGVGDDDQIKKYADIVVPGIAEAVRRILNHNHEIGR